MKIKKDERISIYEQNEKALKKNQLDLVHEINFWTESHYRKAEKQNGPWYKLAPETRNEAEEFFFFTMQHEETKN